MNLNIIIKHKDQKVSTAPCIMSLTPTPTQDIIDAVGLTYEQNNKYDYYHLLTIEKIKEIQNYYNEEIAWCKNFLKEERKSLKDYKEMIPHSSDTDVFNNLIDMYQDAEQLLKDAIKYKHEVEYYYHDFVNLENILKNNEDCELFYNLS